MTRIFARKCGSYNQEEVSKNITSLLTSMGGAASFIKPGQRVLLKPNMLSCKSPDHAATTHPAVVEAVAKAFIEAGAEVIIGDSPPAVFGRTDQYWEKTGFARAAANSGATLQCFETAEKQAIEFETNGKRLSTHIVKTFFEADLVVNLPKLKTHNLTRITAAVKNLFGLVPGLQKALWHKVFPKSLEFSNFMTDLAHKLPTAITILDAVEGMEGQGPAGGNRIFPGFILAATCPVAIDRAICAIANLDENSVAMLRRARELNWGPASASELVFEGAKIDEIAIKDFKVPSAPIQDRIPDLLLNNLKKLVWAGPALKPGKCIKCGRCKEICPVDAIGITQTEAVFDRKKCISCFCCMEVCPVDAIIAEKSPLLNLAMRIRNLAKIIKGRR